MFTVKTFDELTNMFLSDDYTSGYSSEGLGEESCISDAETSDFFSTSQTTSFGESTTEDNPLQGIDLDPEFWATITGLLNENATVVPQANADAINPGVLTQQGTDDQVVTLDINTDQVAKGVQDLYHGCLI